MAHTWSPHLPALRAPAPPQWWQDGARAILARVDRARLARADRPRNPPKHHPARYDYLEAACMAREMERL